MNSVKRGGEAHSTGCAGIVHPGQQMLRASKDAWNSGERGRGATLVCMRMRMLSGSLHWAWHIRTG